MLLIKILFNIIYVTAAWILVIFMYKRKNVTGYKERFTIQCILVSFIILASGETLCSIFGILCSSFEVISGVSVLISRITGVLFIVMLMFAFKYHFNRSFDFYQVFLLFIAIVRIITVIFPGEGLELSGNIIFILLGLGVSFLILRESFERCDQVFTQAGSMFLISILCTIPEMLFNNNALTLFLLVFAKNLAKLSIGFVLLKGLFRKSGINMVKLR